MSKAADEYYTLAHFLDKPESANSLPAEQQTQVLFLRGGVPLQPWPVR